MNQSASSWLSMSIIALLFFIFGFVTWLNGALMPFLKLICDLDDFQSLFVTFAFYIAYTVMAFPMSLILERVGYKNGMALGLGVMAVGALVFIPAAYGASYGLFLIALFTLGTGLTILQTASNPYVVQVGPQESAAMRISLMGIINKSAGVLAPLLFTAFVLSGLSPFEDELMGDATREMLAKRLVTPYLAMAGALFALMIFVKFSPLRDLQFKMDERVHDVSIWQIPRVVLGALAIFFYVGVEVMAGDTIGLFGQQLEVAHYTLLTSYTMVFMVLGYLAGVTAIPRWISQEKALMASASAGLLFLTGVLFSSPESHFVSSLLWGWSSAMTLPDPIAFVALLGLANALVWPTVWPLALEGLGRQSAQGSALLIMGIAGGALLPLLFGKLSQELGGFQSAYAVMLPCYLYILFYAFKGHKITRWKEH